MDYLDKLIALRVDNDLSQKDIGKIIEKSQQGYDHIEKRRAKLAIEDFIVYGLNLQERLLNENFKNICEKYDVLAKY